MYVYLLVIFWNPRLRSKWIFYFLFQDLFNWWSGGIGDVRRAYKETSYAPYFNCSVRKEQTGYSVEKKSCYCRSRRHEREEKVASVFILKYGIYMIVNLYHSCVKLYTHNYNNSIVILYYSNWKNCVILNGL